MKLYGQSWDRHELEARVGRIEQIAGIQRFQLAEGFSAGVQQAMVRTGAGLSYTVNLSKGMDISLAEFGGVPLSWGSPSGDVHPAYYDAEGTGWLRTASGGLLMTCGLTQVGMPNVDQDESLGLHGRIHHTPAHQIATESQWVDDVYTMRVRGVLEETRIFGERLVMRREIRSNMGENSILINDKVENAGHEPMPHMILYHFNFGFPLLMPETKIEFPSNTVTPRDKGVPLEGYAQWETPKTGYQERVYHHSNLTNHNGWSSVKIKNPHFPLPSGPKPLEVHLEWQTETLDRLTQWKMPGASVHVLGVEPANCYTAGRASERQNNSLVILAPGQTKLTPALDE
jgi:hypothetical protein